MQQLGLEEGKVSHQARAEGFSGMGGTIELGVGGCCILHPMATGVQANIFTFLA